MDKDQDKAQQEISLIGRIFCIEALLLLMGLFSLGSGIVTREPTQLFWGVSIVVGAVILHFVRKKDWKKHWEEEERLRQIAEERRRRQKEGDQQ
jgi:uncharacterized membrane protein